MVLLILRNISFENDLSFEEDHVSSIQVASPHLYARFVQSFLAMESGEEPLEHFMLLENDELVNASKILYVFSDPFNIDFADKKITMALYNEIGKLIQTDPQRLSKWERQVIELSEFIQDVSREIPLEVVTQSEITVQAACKAVGLRLDCPPSTSPQVRICKLMDIIAEWMPKKLLVLCNLDGYFSDEDWQETVKYACYTKVKLLLIMRGQDVPLHENEIRWQIDENFDDKILRT